MFLDQHTTIMLVKTTVSVAVLLLLVTLVSGGKKTPEELAVQKEAKEAKKAHNKYEAGMTDSIFVIVLMMTCISSPQNHTSNDALLDGTD